MNDFVFTNSKSKFFKREVHDEKPEKGQHLGLKRMQSFELKPESKQPLVQPFATGSAKIIQKTNKEMENIDKFINDENFLEKCKQKHLPSSTYIQTIEHKQHNYCRKSIGRLSDH